RNQVGWVRPFFLPIHPLHIQVSIGLSFRADFPLHQKAMLPRGFYDVSDVEDGTYRRRRLGRKAEDSEVILIKDVFFGKIAKFARHTPCHGVISVKPKQHPSVMTKDQKLFSLSRPT